MNISFIALGLTMLLGALLLGTSLPTSRAQRIGLGLVFVSGVGTILVGLRPENTVLPLHLLGAGLAFLIGNLGVLVLGMTLKVPLWMRSFTVLCGLLALVALGLSSFHIYLGLGPGGMERVTSYPQTIWMISFGCYLLLRRRDLLEHP